MGQGQARGGAAPSCPPSPGNLCVFAAGPWPGPGAARRLLQPCSPWGSLLGPGAARSGAGPGWAAGGGDTRGADTLLPGGAEPGCLVRPLPRSRAPHGRRGAARGCGGRVSRAGWGGAASAAGPVGQSPAAAEPGAAGGAGSPGGDGGSWGRERGGVGGVRAGAVGWEECLVLGMVGWLTAGSLGPVDLREGLRAGDWGMLGGLHVQIWPCGSIGAWSWGKWGTV